MAMQLLKLLIVLLGMLLLGCRLVRLIVCIAALADKTALLRKVHRVALVYVGESVLRDANLLTLVLLAASGQEIEGRALFTCLVVVSGSARICQDCLGRACQEGVDLGAGEDQALLALVCCLLVAR